MAKIMKSLGRRKGLREHLIYPFIYGAERDLNSIYLSDLL